MLASTRLVYLDSYSDQTFWSVVERELSCQIVGLTTRTRTMRRIVTYLYLAILALITPRVSCVDLGSSLPVNFSAFLKFGEECDNV